MRSLWLLLGLTFLSLFVHALEEIRPYEDVASWGVSYTEEDLESMFESLSLKREFNNPYVLFPASNSRDTNTTNPSDAKVFRFPIDERLELKDGSKLHIVGSYWILMNPVNHFSVVEPYGGCRTHSRATVLTSSKENLCRGATNAGFFDISGTDTDGACLGHVISNGNVVQLGSKLNANFGLLKDGNFILGYPNPNRTSNYPTLHDYKELVTGVGWLVYNRKSFIRESARIENISNQFVEMLSARIGIGHDEHGNLIIVSIDGKSGVWGINLLQLADYMISLGAVNAINLDGGGSVTNVERDVLVNYPTDRCPASLSRFTCPRRVSTITCFKDFP